MKDSWKKILEQFHLFFIDENDIQSSKDSRLSIDFFKYKVISSECFKSDEKPIIFISEYFHDTIKFSFANSSIWCSYLPLKPDNTVWKSHEQFEDYIDNECQIILEKFEKYKFRYHLVNAIENKEFAIRMHKESNLIDMGKSSLDGSSGHYAKVEPFIFHSELKLKNLILQEFKLDGDLKYLFQLLKMFASSNGKLIRIALCDDYANMTINRYSSESSELVKASIAAGIDCSKLSIIEDNLSLVPNCNGLEIETFSSVVELIESQQKFDIILLDYLFSVGKDGSKLTEPNYGTELFTKVIGINSKSKSTLPYGYLGKHWILPISAFSDSMVNELQNMGITFTSEEIYLSKGADPITEPYLFLYELFYMINEQIKIAISWAVDWDTLTKVRIKEVLTKVKGSKHTDLENSRDEWIKSFSEVSDIFRKITQLEIDSKDIVNNNVLVEGSHSFLARSLVTYLQQDENRSKIRILTHYRDLLYQLAFKPYKDNEYIFIEANKLHQALNS